MQELQQKSNELLQEEIRRAIREKLSRFTFPCPHCREHIKDEDFGKEQQAFHYISEIVRRALEEQIVPQWDKHKRALLEEMRNLKIYEEFPEVKELREAVKKYSSPDYIENSIRVKKLEEEKKEVESKHWKTIESLQNKNQELQKELSEKKEQIQNLMLRQKGQSKGQEFENWFFEQLVAVFQEQDIIEDVSKGQAGVGKRADFLQKVLINNDPEKVAGRIVYETKNTEKWDNS